MTDMSNRRTILVRNKDTNEISEISYSPDDFGTEMSRDHKIDWALGTRNWEQVKATKAYTLTKY